MSPEEIQKYKKAPKAPNVLDPAGEAYGSSFMGDDKYAGIYSGAVVGLIATYGAIKLLTWQIYVHLTPKRVDRYAQLLMLGQKGDGKHATNVADGLVQKMFPGMYDFYKNKNPMWTQYPGAYEYSSFLRVQKAADGQVLEDRGGVLFTVNNEVRLQKFKDLLAKCFSENYSGSAEYLANRSIQTASLETLTKIFTSDHPADKARFQLFMQDYPRQFKLLQQRYLKLSRAQPALTPPIPEPPIPSFQSPAEVISSDGLTSRLQRANSTGQLMTTETKNYLTSSLPVIKPRLETEPLTFERVPLTTEQAQAFASVLQDEVHETSNAVATAVENTATEVVAQATKSTSAILREIALACWRGLKAGMKFLARVVKAILQSKIGLVIMLFIAIWVIFAIKRSQEMNRDFGYALFHFEP